jgi:nitroreductase
MLTSDKINEIKKAESEYPILELIANRWSPRAISNQPVEEQKFKSLFEAARWAPSAFNKQPWSFYAGKQGDEIYQKIFGCLFPFNQTWVAAAPILVLCVADTLDPKGEMNRSYAYDCGQAVANLSIQATSEGLFVHQMAGMDYKKLAEIFELPEFILPVIAFAIGYHGDIEQLPEGMQKTELTPRTRKKLEEFVTML